MIGQHKRNSYTPPGDRGVKVIHWPGIYVIWLSDWSI